ncbi:MAG: 30S ribosomal protein S7 [Thermoleophilia bacterium]|nr:30S ribosomal protein S7 [Thermoleophilia bacterium]
MPRRAAAQKREITPDPVYNSQLVAQFVTKVMLGGKKSTAEKITYRALEIIGEKKGEDPVSVLKQAVDTVTPQLEVRSRRVGGATYQVPVEVPSRRARTLAVRWLVGYARDRREKTMAERLANECLDALANQGGAWKKKDDLYRMAQANKAFAHYRW